MTLSWQARLFLARNPSPELALRQIGWDEPWQTAYDRARRSGASPNRAVQRATNSTEARYGPRPEQDTTMTEEELREYAETLLLEHARDVEWLTIHEMAEQHVDGGVISDEDAKRVDDLIGKATVTVSWPEVSS